MKIIVVLGQTATGKSDFAVDVARQINGEIISADSRQVYKGMNLGTGKITKKEMLGVPHYLLDVINPSKVFTVNDFQKKALKEIDTIYKRGKVPIICGGTGFYIDAIVNGTMFPDVPPNKKLRTELYLLDAIALSRYLEKLDPERLKTIDKNNKVRLVRAIEIAKALGKVPKVIANKNNFELLKIGLTLPPEILKERIYTRLLSRIKKGMAKEIENLHKGGITWKRLHSFGLEYRYVSMYLQGKFTKSEMIEKLNTEIWHFAKRQNTWFKRDTNTIWINPLKKSDKIKVMKEVKRFLK
ncbi:MAG: tRNA (adenosine(37)-N6)-dimethylallyltransferase MiaA [Candidatus Nomurabacteria bacterium]|nr:tRNA (adenosine(37)-N6)-dimethylallyltransferase MiaA [Candidatus Nomurabacteria bacterium]